MIPSPDPSAEAAPLYALLYRSVASAALTVGDVLDIFETSKRRNAQRGVTGLLLYTGVSLGAVETPRPTGGPLPDDPSPDGRVDQFVQWLEGPEDAVRELYGAISRDPRHHGCEVLLAGPSAELVGSTNRLFPDWSMRFGRVPALPVTVVGLRRAADRLRQRRSVGAVSEATRHRASTAAETAERRPGLAGS